MLVSVRTPLSSAPGRSARSGAISSAIFVNKSRGVAALISVRRIVALWPADQPLPARQVAARGGRQSRTPRPTWASTSTRRIAIAFALGVGITGIAGGLLATNYPFHPFVGLEYVIVMYAGVVLGGMGSIIGPFWGGMTIGLVQQLSTLVLPTQLQNTAIFVVFLLIVVFRPQGFFGRVGREDLRWRCSARSRRSSSSPRSTPPLALLRQQLLLPADDDAGAGLGQLRPVLEPAQRLHRPRLVRPRGLLRHRRLHHGARPDPLRPVALAADPGRGRARRRSQGC